MSLLEKSLMKAQRSHLALSRKTSAGPNAGLLVSFISEVRNSPPKEGSLTPSMLADVKELTSLVI